MMLAMIAIAAQGRDVHRLVFTQRRQLFFGDALLPLQQLGATLHGSQLPVCAARGLGTALANFAVSAPGRLFALACKSQLLRLRLEALPKAIQFLLEPLSFAANDDQAHLAVRSLLLAALQRFAKGLLELITLTKGFAQLCFCCNI
jgi:hypothetical protein